MRRLFAAPLLFLLMACPPPPQLCQTQTDLTCDRFFECADAATKAALAPTLGNDVATCKSTLYAARNCLGKKKDDDLCIDNPFNPSGATHFHLTNAIDCINQQKKLSCADFMKFFESAGATGFADTSSVPSCASECQ